MKIDNKPIVSGNTFTVKYNIDKNVPVAISVNGLITIDDSDIVNIVDNVIYVSNSIYIDLVDDFVVYYNNFLN